ncbi:hypothetical protein GCM10009615_09950 [Corynebacterium durum]
MPTFGRPTIPRVKVTVVYPSNATGHGSTATITPIARLIDAAYATASRTSLFQSVE